MTTYTIHTEDDTFAINSDTPESAVKQWAKEYYANLSRSENIAYTGATDTVDIEAEGMDLRTYLVTGEATKNEGLLYYVREIV